MFRKMGYTANVTPPSNDGGYDIELRSGCESAIIECKCYSLKHSVGRPLIQKLVGANSVVKADRMIFVTTSHFSAGAIEYATEVGVELIDSVELVKLLRQYGIIAREKLEISEAEWQLQIADLASYVPWDIYESFLQD